MTRTLRMKYRVLALLTTGGLASVACGGSVDDGRGAGGSGGTGVGGSGGSVGGSGGSVGGSGGSVGGSGGSVGGSGGSVGGAGGAVGGAGGSAGFGGTAGVSGSGGTAGNATCDCGPAWQSCWLPQDVPLIPGVTPVPNGICPATADLDGSNYQPCGGVNVWFYNDPVRMGELCCYTTEFGCAIGRPFLVHDEVRTASTVLRADWSDASQASATQRAIGEAWLNDALLEHASVAAFARLTLQLMEHGAPPDLIRLSQSASLDEIDHAQRCFTLASRYLGRRVGPGKLALDGALESVSLCDLAVMTFREGCVGETVAAMLAGDQHEQSRDQQVQETLAIIEDDETRHAELAWRVVSWAIEQGGEPVSRAIRQELAAMELESSASATAVDSKLDALYAADAEWRAHGRLTPREAAAVRARVLREVVIPCTRALLGELEVPRQVA